MFQHSSILLLFTLVLHGVQSQGAPTVTIQSQSYTPNSGTRVTLQCTASGNPAVTLVTWYKTSGGVETTVAIDSSKNQGGNVASPSLIIYGLSSSDTASYKCRATNTIGSSDSAQIALNVNVIAGIPTVTIGLGSYNINSGTTVTLQCTVGSTVTVTAVSWSRILNGVPSSITVDNSKYTNANTGNPSLTIASTTNADDGIYVCSATNSAGTSSSLATVLTVTTTSIQIPTVTIFQTAFGAQVSTTITLGCTVTSAATVLSVYWRRDMGSGFVDITIDGTHFSGSTITVPSLTLINADITDSGTYQCFATNAGGIGSSATASVTISSAAPSVNIQLASYTTTIGTTYTIPCSVSSTTTVTNVFWQRTINGQTSTITIDGVNFSGATTGAPSLNIITASISDSGTYICSATNSAGTGSDATQLTVSGGVPAVTISQTGYSTITGNSITLGCTVSADPTHTSVFWQLNINGITQNITIDGVNYSGSTVNSPSLTVLHANTGDSGTYTCFATNSLGTGQSSQTTLTVTGSKFCLFISIIFESEIILCQCIILLKGQM
ncbi:basement membrane-specific heparan sulfate proteoglycan core protein-like [Mizuhopecten yessoensis]|uniref:Basement membrane-specific heparan sulfate proteoglycan core protein n=1 Tax=Mizuhopecten yessoensis TaxID=6573 RepID=A0A210PZ74_MIZYE|nr:basement membrane-specific heparan sulfate proteoglycan core protein-like [Mizuhopecten yessoensis]OWF41783.1 Basement membrane-specific heparan sulfate proteoglycan core protein [Mizuhopecten yessoensis]